MQTCGQTARNNTISEKNIKVALRGASKCSRRDKHNETDSVSTFGECTVLSCNNLSMYTFTSVFCRDTASTVVTRSTAKSNASSRNWHLLMFAILVVHLIHTATESSQHLAFAFFLLAKLQHQLQKYVASLQNPSIRSINFTTSVITTPKSILAPRVANHSTHDQATPSAPPRQPCPSRK